MTVSLLNGSGVSTGTTATTDANGNVSFAGLALGSYEVGVTTPTGDVVTQKSNVGTPITLSSGQTGAAVEGVYAPAKLTTHVYFDTNGNSSQDGNESGLAGVTVSLLNGSGVPTGTTAITDANGNVSFAGLAPGSYEVSVVTPTGDVTTQKSNIQTPITLTSGQTGAATEGVTAAGPTAATFKAHVYYDTNKDGAQSAGETNMAGVTVQLLNGLGAPTGKSAVTDSSGNVSFTSLTPGSYEVAVVTPTGDIVTKAVNVGTPNTLVAGGTASAIEGLVAKGPAITVDKVASATAINAGGTETYTFKVTNTGTAALDNIKLSDNIGTAANPIILTPTAVYGTGCQNSGNNIGDTNHNGLLDVGETWTYQVTVKANEAIIGNSSTSAAVSLPSVGPKGGQAIWVNSVLHTYSNTNGTTYHFTGLTATITAANGTKYTYAVPDSTVTFSQATKTATTTWDSASNTWVTTLPAGSSLGNVFMSGAAITVPAGVNLKGASVTMTAAACDASTGAIAPTWQIGASAYSSTIKPGGDASQNYNLLGVKCADNPGPGGHGGPGDKAGAACDLDDDPNCGPSGATTYSAPTVISLGVGVDRTLIDNVSVTAQTIGGCGGGGSGSWDSGNSCWVQPTGTSNGNQCGNNGGDHDDNDGGNCGSTVTTVSATDMANVQVLATNKIQLGGTAPSGSLSTLFGAATKLEFAYNASNVVSVAGLQTGIAQANGNNTSSMAFIEVSNSSNAFDSAAKQYFLGEVSNGAKLIADATTSIGNVAIPGGQFSTAAGQDLYVYVFADQNSYNAHAAAQQTIVYDTTGANGGMHINDQIGSVKLIGYVGTTGQGYLVA